MKSLSFFQDLEGMTRVAYFSRGSSELMGGVDLAIGAGPGLSVCRFFIFTWDEFRSIAPAVAWVRNKDFDFPRSLASAVGRVRRKEKFFNLVHFFMLQSPLVRSIGSIGGLGFFLLKASKSLFRMAFCLPLVLDGWKLWPPDFIFLLRLYAFPTSSNHLVFKGRAAPRSEAGR